MIARLAIGEEILASLKDLARAEEIPWAWIQGIGAIDDLTLALYDPAERRYRESVFRENLEVVSMSGNIAWLGDDPVVHAHGVFSRVDCTTVGGHIVRGCVSVTLEATLAIGEGRLERRPDDRVGLNLLDIAPAGGPPGRRIS